MDKQVAQLTTPSADTRGKKITRYVLYAFCAVVVAHYQKNGALPRNLADLGLAPPGVPYLEALGFRDGMITFTPKDTHTRGTITWTPVVEGKTVSWHCSATGFRNGDLPSECRRQR
jgi:hypothetical protein